MRAELFLLWCPTYVTGIMEPARQKLEREQGPTMGNKENLSTLITTDPSTIKFMEIVRNSAKPGIFYEYKKRRS